MVCEGKRANHGRSELGIPSSVISRWSGLCQIIQIAVGMVQHFMIGARRRASRIQGEGLRASVDDFVQSFSEVVGGPLGILLLELLDPVQGVAEQNLGVVELQARGFKLFSIMSTLWT